MSICAKIILFNKLVFISHLNHNVLFANVTCSADRDTIYNNVDLFDRRTERKRIYSPRKQYNNVLLQGILIYIILVYAILTRPVMRLPSLYTRFIFQLGFLRLHSSIIFASLLYQTLSRCITST